MSDESESYYPKQRMSEAFRRAGRWVDLSKPRERVRTGDWPAFSLRNQRVDERNDLRARNDREYSYRMAKRAMSTRTSRR